MSNSTNFVAGTVVQPAWLNDVNNFVFGNNTMKHLIVDYGAVGNGVTDDTAALNAAAASGSPVDIPANFNFTTSTGFQLAHGTKFIGSGNFSGTANAFQGTGVSQITYTGAGGTNSCVVNISDAAVGTMPTTPVSRDMQNTGFTNIKVNAALAQFGVYGVRCLSNNNLDFITVVGSTLHAIWVNICFNGFVRNWNTYETQGAGITIGVDTFGWGTGTVDQTVFASIFAYYAGCDAAGNPLNQFNETTNQALGYGIRVGGGRGLTFLNAQANNCDGVGLYISPGFKPVQFIGGYFEGNSRSSQIVKTDTFSGNGSTTVFTLANAFGNASYAVTIGGTTQPTSAYTIAYSAAGPSTTVTFTTAPVSGTNNIVVTYNRQWAIWFNGVTGGMSQSITWDSTYLGLSPSVRLTGTIPSRVECGPVFRNLLFLPEINSDWSNFRTFDCSRTCNYTGVAPAAFRQQVNGYRNMDIIGIATFDASGGSINLLNMEGIISSIAYTGVGIYTVTLKETFSSARYGAWPSSTANRIAGVTLSASSFIINHSIGSTGTATDGGARISVMVTGYYT